jgi:hypothetical protein
MKATGLGSVKSFLSDPRLSALIRGQKMSFKSEIRNPKSEIQSNAPHSHTSTR